MWHIRRALVCGAIVMVSLPAQVTVVQDPIGAVLAAEVEPVAGDGVALEVRHEDGRPVAGAIVTVVDATARQRLAAAQPNGWHGLSEAAVHARFALACGRRWATDDQGRVRVVVPAGRGIVAVFAGDTWGLRYLDAGTTTLAPITVYAPRHVDVQVVDPRGRPVARVTVGLTDIGDAGAGPQLGQSDADGWVRLEVPIALRPRPKVRLVAHVALASPCAQILDLASPEIAPVRLQLPPTGLLRVIAYDAKEHVRSDVRSVLVRHGHLHEWPGADLDGSGGLMRVGLGLCFTVRAHLTHAAGALEKRDVAGPTRADELVIVDLRDTQGQTVLVVPVLDVAGVAMRRETFGVALLDPPRRLLDPVTADADGVLRIVLPADLTVDQTLLLVRRDSTGASLGAARVAITDPRAGHQAVAPVRLKSEPRLLSASVVDGTGTPIPDVELRLATGWFPERQSPQFQHRVRTDAFGRFEVCEASDAPSLRLVHVPAGFALREPVDSAVPCRPDATIVLERTGGIRLGLRTLPAGVPFALNAELVAPGTERAVDSIRLSGSGGRLVAPAGSYDVCLRLAAATPILVRIENVRIFPAVDADDERLRAIDWSSALDAVTFAVLDRAARPATGTTVLQFMPGENGKLVQISGGKVGKDGTTNLVRPRTGSVVCVGAHSPWQPRLLTELPAGGVVTLEPRPSIEFALARPLALPPGFHLRLQVAPLVPTDDTERQLAWLLAPITNPATPMRATFARPGKYAVTAVCEHPDLPAGRHATVAWATIDVTALPSDQPFPLPLAANADAALVELAERLARDR